MAPFSQGRHGLTLWFMVVEPDRPSVADLATSITGADEARRKPTPPVESWSQRRKRARDAGCWFMPKRWGGGWVAVSWQGNVVFLVALTLMALSLVMLDKPASFVCTTLVIVATLLLAETKGKPTRQPMRE